MPSLYTILPSALAAWTLLNASACDCGSRGASRSERAVNPKANSEPAPRRPGVRIVAKGTEASPATPSFQLCDLKAPEDAQTSNEQVKFKILQEGTGKHHPRSTDIVSIAYRITSGDGVAQQQTVTAPVGSLPNRSASELIGSMVEGEYRQIWVTSKWPRHSFLPEGRLCWDVYMASINPDLKNAQQPLPEGFDEVPTNAKQLVDGIKYQVLKEGTGAHPEQTDVVEIVLSLWIAGGPLKGNPLASNRVMRSAVNGGHPTLARVLPKMKEGDVWKIWLPPGTTIAPPRGPVEVPMVAKIKLSRIF